MLAQGDLTRWAIIASVTDLTALPCFRMRDCFFTLMHGPNAQTENNQGNWAAYCPVTVGVFVAKGRCAQ